MTDVRAPEGDLLTRYIPRKLDAARWKLAADDAREAVRRIETTDQVRLSILSTLSTFLSSPVWDGDSAPDLRELLTEASITAYTEQMPAAATRRIVRSNLRRLRLVVGARDVAVVAAVELPKKKRYPSALLVEGAHRPIPAKDLFRTWMRVTGNTMNGNPLEPVIAHWKREGTFTARAGDQGTVWPATSLAALTEVNHRTEKATVTSHAAKLTTTPAKPMSRKAAVAHAKKARAAAAAAAAPAEVTRAAEADVRGDIRRVVEAFSPRAPRDAVWAANDELAKALVYGHNAPSTNNAKTVCTYVARFLHWYAGSTHRNLAGHTEPRIAAHELLDARLIDYFIDESGMPNEAKSTTRSALRRALGSLNPTAKPVVLPQHQALAPYTALECAQFIHVALHQPTSAARSNMCFIVGLGLGAGLDATDLNSLNRNSLAKTVAADGKTSYLVTVNTGTKCRTVPVRSAYVHLVERALSLHSERVASDTAPLVGRHGGKNAVGAAIDRAKTADDSALALDIRRLRNTWLVLAMSSPVPLADLMRAAGLASSRTFANLLPYCPPSDQATLDQVLTDMNDVFGGPAPAYARPKRTP